jgi:riboflavin kinase/FMN adenylyltransferase
MSATIVRLDAARARPRRVAVGKFDGLHLGHRAVVSGCDAVCTFDPHPSVVLAQGPPPPLLTSLRRRAELLGAMGVEELVVLPFDEAMRARSPQAFIEEVLLDGLGATHVRVGADFRFGHRAAGRPDDLLADGRVRCRVIEPVLSNGATISSTRIRALVAAGAMAEAAELLGAPHAVWCRRGPDSVHETELEAPGLALPPEGAYAVRLLLRPGSSRVVARCRVTTDHEDGCDRRIVLDETESGLLGEELRIEFVERITGRAAQPRRAAALRVS